MIVETQCAACGRPLTVNAPMPVEAVFAVCSDCETRAHLQRGGLVTGFGAPPEGARFPLGPVKVTPGAVQWLGTTGAHWWELVARHARGDWGSAGRLDQTTVTAKERAGGAAETDDTAKLNKIAIAMRHGMVMSVYEQHQADRPGANDSDKTSKPGPLWVLTHLREGGHAIVGKQDGTTKYPEARDFFLDVAFDAWRVFDELRRDQGFSVFREKRTKDHVKRSPVKKDARTGKVIDVAQGVLFPVMSALGKFARRDASGHWKFEVPDDFDMNDLIQAAELTFSNKQDPAKMGKESDCYLALHPIVTAYLKYRSK